MWLTHTHTEVRKHVMSKVAVLKQKLTKLTNQATEVRKQIMPTAMEISDDPKVREVPQATQIEKPTATPVADLKENLTEVIMSRIAGLKQRLTKLANQFTKVRPKIILTANSLNGMLTKLMSLVNEVRKQIMPTVADLKQNCPELTNLVNDLEIQIISTVVDWSQNLTELTNQHTEVRKQIMSTVEDLKQKLTGLTNTPTEVRKQVMSIVADLKQNLTELKYQDTEVRKQRRSAAMEMSDDPKVREVPQGTQLQKPAETPVEDLKQKLTGLTNIPTEVRKQVKSIVADLKQKLKELKYQETEVRKQRRSAAMKMSDDPKVREVPQGTQLQKPAETPGLPMGVDPIDVKYGEVEASRLVKFIMQTKESKEGEEWNIQTARMKEVQPVFKQSHVKTTVPIAEDTDVDDSDISKSQGAAAKSPEASTSTMSEMEETSTVPEMGETSTMTGDPMTGSPMPGSSKVDFEQTMSPVDQSSLLLRRPPKKEQVKEVEKEKYGKMMLPPSEEGLGTYLEKMKSFPEEYTKGSKPGMTDVLGTETAMSESETQATQKKLRSLQQEEPKS